MESCDPKNLNSTFNKSLCDYVRNSKYCSFDAGFINYFQWQYCSFDNRVAPTILMFIWFLILLLAVAVTADSFFAPCLVVVTRILRMSQNLAGVTLLALGNGAADVFSSLSAVMSTNSPNVNLALGSILGAGILVNTITAGIIMIIVPFQVMRRPIIKDLVFYLLALIWCMIILIQKKIELWSSIVFLTIYIIYVTVTGVSRAIYVKFEGNNEIKENKKESNDNEINGSKHNIQSNRDNLAYINDIEQCNSINTISSAFQDSVNISRKSNAIQNSQINSQLGFIPMYSFNSKRIPSIRSRTMGSLAKIIIENEHQKEALETNLKKQEKLLQRKRSLSFDVSTEIPNLNNRIRFISLSHNNSNEIKKSVKEKPIQAPDLGIINEEDQLKRTESTNSMINLVSQTSFNQNTENSQFPGLFKHFFMKIIPINFEEWKEESIFSKILSVIQSPIMFILTLTIPVVEDEEYLKGWCKILNCFHCISSPLIWITFINYSQITIGKSAFLVIYLIMIIGMCAGILIVLTTKADTPPRYYSAFAFIGFLTSIFWIYEIANEIVNVLETFGVVLSIPQTVLGLSVLAFANSIGDLVSNIMLAKRNFPKIAYAACIGGPLFNLLVGIGLPFSIVTAKYGIVQIDVQSETIVLITTILLITAMNLICLPIMRFHMRPGYGIVLIVFYIVFFILVLLFATKVINVIL